MSDEQIESILKRIDPADGVDDGRWQSYIEVPVGVAKASSDDELQLSEPFLYVAGKNVEGRYAYQEQQYAVPPTVALVTAEYGMGKSELFAMLKKYVNNNRGLLGGRRAVIIELGRRPRSDLLVDQKPHDPTALARRFGELVFGEMSDADYKLLRGAVRAGWVLLLLDGLDELLAHRNMVEYNQFFVGLACFAGVDNAGLVDPPKYLILVSMRREFLVSVNDQKTGRAAKVLHTCCGHEGLSVDFLVLSPFGESQVGDYVARHFREPECIPPHGLGAKEVLDRIQHSDRLLQIVARPLLLRMWCELVSDLGKNVSAVGEEVELFQKYVERASERQKELYGGAWDLAKLALKALELFANAKSEILSNEIIILLDESWVGERPVDTQVAIHKCPFLQETPHGVRFAHRAFFEYFTARGVDEKLKADPPDPEPFNDLVLNTDMRKFLKFLLGHQRFNDLARTAWGLDDPQWELSIEDGERFEAWHRRLLESMTIEWHEARAASELREAVDGFLGKVEDNFHVHPAYLIYAFESIGVQFARDTKANIRDQRNRFSEVLRSTAVRVISRLERAKGGGGGEFRTEAFGISDYDSKYELLLEKVLDLGTRLHLDWVKKYCYDRTNDVSDLVVDIRTKMRVTRILDRLSRRK
jgi:hypothetical protein